ncbi:MAG TPA: TPM domain-containing protein [Usitatibacter sp.]|nr:TPM domain-containing protein [Usitatibacter sp.]
MRPAVRRRAGPYKIAWILFAAAIVVPAFPAGGLYPAGPFAVAKAILWTEAFSEGRPGPSFPVLALFAFSLFSNLLFAYAPLLRKRARASRAAIILWITALAVNVGVGIALPVFLASLGYWVWLAAFATMAWALIGLQEPAAVAYPNSDIAPIVWIGLAWLVFWLAVTAVHHYGFDEELQRAAAADERAEQAGTLTHHFNDPDGLVPEADAVRFARTLEQIEKETSNQVAVAIYREAPPGVLEEFTLRTAELSKLGMKGLDNGAILFVFVEQRLARLEVGYGLEGTLTDADTHRILEERLGRWFARGEYSRGIDETLAALVARVRDEYKSGRAPGEATILYRQLKAELPKFARKSWPVINAVPTGSRIAASIMATVLLGIAFSGVSQTLRLLRAAATAARNIHRRQPVAQGIGTLEWVSIFDMLKIAILLGIPVAAAVGTVIIAGGGTFGGAGATLRW